MDHTIGLYLQKKKMSGSRLCLEAELVWAHSDLSLQGDKEVDSA